MNISTWSYNSQHLGGWASKKKLDGEFKNAPILMDLKLAAHEALAVGDTPYDAVAANKVHLRTIGITGYWSEKELRDSGCIEIFTSPADLLEHYDQSALAEAQAA